ncbi:MAG TPA: squalene--hopene cyclase [Gaiellaceae bacterium]|jgi:squalene-hopene/tetraprenyl-beta-curcumene cyclase
MTIVQELTGLDTAVELGAERLLSLQHPDGWWKGELESNATMIAEHLFLLHFLGLRDAETDRLLANELLARRRADGTWSIWFEGPADLSVTVEAYTALKLVGVDAGDETRDYIRRNGGVARARIFTRAFLALIGQWPWRRLAHVPVELILLPANGPLSVYDLACWARQTMVSLSVVEALQPVRPSAIDLSEIGGRKTAASGRPRLSGRRRRAIAVAEQWVRERQEADGSWGGIQPPWVWSLIMLAALGHGFEDETFARGLAGWERFMVRDGDRLRPEACQSPIWDTALAVLALRAAGFPADDPRLQAAGSWLLGEEVTVRGDWAIRRPDLAPGGWSFEFDNDLYPDVDDTAVVAVALRELELGDEAVRRGLDWTVGMQSRSGGWGAFDADNEALWLYRLPMCDFGKVTDEPTADVTAHALEALGREPGYDSAVAAGLDWLLAEQESDGSWFGRWGVNHVYGTGAAVPALEACGVAPEHPAIRRALAWLDSVQQPSGAFGEDVLSYSDPARRGRGAATPSQTAWALLAYVAGGAERGLSTRRAAEYLCQSQRPNGDWDEQHYTGTGFPLDFMIGYHLYRHTFPLLALGRLRERLNG